MHCTVLVLAVMAFYGTGEPMLVGGLPPAPYAGEPRGSPDGDLLTKLREFYFASVADARAIEPGIEEIERLRSAERVPPGSEKDGILTAYYGALVTLRAKHARMPHDKLRFVREGLRGLDAAVAAHPQVVEIRYLLLMSGYYLPAFFGRSGSVRTDLAELARLLPDARDRFPGGLYRTMVGFVLEKGTAEPADRVRLQAALDSAGG
jgi:hypothetical protein